MPGQLAHRLRPKQWPPRALARETRLKAKKHPQYGPTETRVMMECNRNSMSKKIKVHSLTGRITLKLMEKAFKKIKSNRGAAGVDGASVAMFEANLEQNLNALMRDLKKGSFEAKPLRRVYIPKDPRGKKTRPLGIPVVRDRVAQEVLRLLLEPVFEPLFHHYSFGFRRGRNCHMAIEEALRLHGNGLMHVLDADIKGFFDNLPHKVMVDLVAEEVADGNILRLIQKFLTAGVMEDGVYKPTNVGTPQGGVISPLLANIALNKLDWALHGAGYKAVRYADDFVVITRTERQAQEARKIVEHTIATLGLELSPEKTRVTTYKEGYEFLGFLISSRTRRMRDKSVERFKDKVRDLTQRHHNLDKKAVEKLNRVIRGTANYFITEFSTFRLKARGLDSWIRMRLRCMKTKRKSILDNRKLKVRYFREKLGLISLLDYCPPSNSCRSAGHHSPKGVPR